MCSIGLASLHHLHKKLLRVCQAIAVVVLCEGVFCVLFFFFPSGCALFISVLGEKSARHDALME